jgi:hypothetical protein
MSNRITFTRNSDGSYPLGESQLRPLVERLYADNQEPRVPVSLMSEASAELVSAAHRLCNTRGLDFCKAAAILVRERPSLFRLTRCTAVAEGASADLEVGT